MNTFLLKASFVAVIVLFWQSAVSTEIIVRTQDQYEQAVSKAKPGDIIVLADGEWKDFEILFTGEGTAEKPIRLEAQTKGKVIVTGQSNLRIAGDYLEVSGLVFKDGYTPTGTVVSFRRNKDHLANYSRVTEIVIDNFNNPERRETEFWVLIYGKHNRFDHNALVGKRTKGVTMAVRLNSEASIENHHQIDHNYFGPRPILGSNGGETLRIGTSHYSLSNSYTVVENNYFDRCNGELEIISNKSGSNIIRGNVFYESRGTLTLRHGNDNIIEDNVFFGNGVDHTGGIRVINANQTIRNNYMEGLAGYRFGGALVVMNGVPNSPINRYHQVSNALIENNSLINSDHIQLAAGSDDERSATPVNSQFSKNIIFTKEQKKLFTIYDDVSGIEFTDNLLSGASDKELGVGFKSSKIKLKRAANGLMYPQNKKYASWGVSGDLNPIAKSQVGPNWYEKPGNADVFNTGKVIKVSNEEGELFAAVKNASAGDILELHSGNYTVSKILKIDKPLTIRSQKSKKSSIEVSFERSALFEIVDGGSLSLSGFEISGKDSPDSAGNAVIRTSGYSMLHNYRLIINNMKVSDLDINHSFNFINVAKNTVADSIDINNSIFSDVTGAILKLDKEIDDYGIYNAEYLNIANSHFSNIGGALVDFYRGGTDESTFGPHFSLTDSSLNNVGNDKRNKSKASIHLHGVQLTTIENNQFTDSPAIKLLHTVGEPRSTVIKNTFSNTPLPVVKELNSAKENTAIIRDNKVSKDNKNA